MPTDVTVSIGCTTESAHRSGSCGVTTASPSTLEDLGALVFGDHALHLQEQVVLRRAPNRPVEEHHFRAGSMELLDEKYLIGVAACQPIRSQNVDTIDAAPGDRIAQTFECRSHQRRAAITLVDKRMIRVQQNLVGLGPLSQCCQLAGDGVATGLLVARDSGIECSRDLTHAHFRDESGCSLRP
jgi:hypothetical protein